MRDYSETWTSSFSLNLKRDSTYFCCMQKDTRQSWRRKLHETIYESNTTAGKTFDIVLLVCIIGSIIIVTLDSVEVYRNKFGKIFYILEWIFTGLFTIEYILRLISINRPL